MIAAVRQRTEALMARAHHSCEMSTGAVISRKELLRDGKPHSAARFGSSVMVLAVTMSMLTSPTIDAAEAGLSRTLDGMTIYLGVIASKIASQHLPTHEEAQIHGRQ